MIRKTGGDRESLLILCLLFMGDQKFKEALVVLHELLKLDPDDIVVNLLSCEVYQTLNLDETYELIAVKFESIAKRTKLRQLKLLDYTKDELQASPGHEYHYPDLLDEQFDEMMILTAKEIIKFNFTKVAKIFYEKIRDKEAI